MTLRVPPRWLRRVVLAPAVVVLAVLLLPTELMLALLLGGLTSWLAPGRLRVPRLLWFGSFYVLWQAAALLALFCLWVASGFGAAVRRPGFRRAHYALARVALDVLFWQVRWTFQLRIEFDDTDVGRRFAGRPVIVAARHAGPGDSLVLVHTLLSAYGRTPRIVLKDKLQWDPAIDVLLNRVPAVFVTPRSTRSAGPALVRAVGDLAGGMEPTAALVVFPEGGHVTPRRRGARLEALRSAGRDGLAESAEQMRHVMAPYAGGVLAAIAQAPEAGVVFVAHTGLDRLMTVRDLWRELPMDKRVTFKAWAVDPADIPAARDEQETWLFDWWLRVDRWISEHPEAPVPRG